MLPVQGSPGMAQTEDESARLQQGSVNQLYTMVQSLTVTVGTVVKEMGQLTTNVKLLTEKAPAAPSHQNAISDNDLYLKFQEFEDRRRRRDCLIIRGINAENTTQLVNSFQAITEEITGTRTTPANTSFISKEKKIFRVEIPNREARMNILANSKKLKDSANFSSVFFNKDLTYQQRQAAKTRREEARRKNAESNGPRQAIRGIGRGNSFAGNRGAGRGSSQQNLGSGGSSPVTPPNDIMVAPSTPLDPPDSGEAGGRFQ